MKKRKSPTWPLQRFAKGERRQYDKSEIGAGVIRLIAYGSGYMMVRRPGYMPFIMRERDYILLERLSWGKK